MKNFGAILKINTVVIMDGTHKHAVRVIRELCRSWSPIMVNCPTVRSMRGCESSMVVIETQMYDEQLNLLNKEIEERFPGLCIFNPPMAV